MAFRGRGRGRGGFGGGGFRAAKQEKFDLFPEIEELGTAEGVKVDPSFAVWYSKFQRYWNSSPYYVEDESGGAKKSQSTEIEKYSDRKSKKKSSKQPLSHFIRMEPDYVPAELAKGEKKEKHGAKRVRWNPEADMKKLDVFEKLEQKHQGQEINEKEDEEEEDEKLEEEEEEYSDDGDYNQNIDFDDDEDDFNMGDDNDDEPEL
ncbi:uncharacterized protein [Coffea arabica]|uniref:Uncharacterized protein n=1 Tax=Coffea arabica TaxID=13443 RepID=A0A6P6WF25_COFAR|nr:DNA-directed RNA polymerase III subunit RPC7-like [Coffea arabica]XP_027113960.1 DNA-directed RNA polymerase III subunit RPC7-like [Coffea arabica]